MRTVPLLATLLISVHAASQTWSLLQPATSPPAARGAGMGFDGSRLVLFGGAANGTMPPTPFGTTWAFNGTTWSTLTPPLQPSARVHHSMSSIGNAVLLFGGIDHNGSPLNDTWVWNGTTWQTGAFSSRPSPRCRAAMTGGAVFGGLQPTTSTVLGDSWFFQDLQSGWVVAYPPVAPRRDAAMAYTFHGLLLHGGRDAQGTILSETRFNDQLLPDAGGPARAEHTLVYDPRSGMTLLFGGVGPGGLATDMWRFESTNRRWLQVTPATMPTPTALAVAAYDGARQRVAVVGGTGPGPSPSMAEHWEFAWPLSPTQSIGTPCSNATWFGFPRGPIFLYERQWIGGGGGPGGGHLFVGREASWSVDYVDRYLGDVPFLAIGFDDVQWDGAPLPLNLGPIGLPQCNVYIAPSMFLPMGISGSHAALVIQVPADAALLHQRVLAQAVVLHPDRIAFITNATSSVLN